MCEHHGGIVTGEREKPRPPFISMAHASLPISTEIPWIYVRGQDLMT